jgi:hypothetical protein
LATVTIWFESTVSPAVATPPVFKMIDPTVPEVTEPVLMMTLPELPVPEPPAPEVILTEPPVALLVPAAPPMIFTAPPFEFDPTPSPPVKDAIPPVPEVVAAPPASTRFLPLFDEEGADGAIVRFVPAAVERVVISGVLPPLRANTPVEPLKVTADPFKANCPEVLPTVTPTEFAVPSESVPEAALMAAEAPRFRVVVEVAAKVAAVVKVVKLPALKVVAVGRERVRLLIVVVPVPDWPILMAVPEPEPIFTVVTP